MTIEPEAIDPQVNEKIEDVLQQRRAGAVLEELFTLGYTVSESKVIFEDEKKDLLVEVTFRTLTPSEHRDIYETLGSFMHPEAQFITQKLETLARAIVKMNGMPLTLSASEQESYAEKIGRSPTPLDQARLILTTQVKSTLLVNMLYKTYIEFTQEVEKAMEDLKKKQQILRFFQLTCQSYSITKCSQQKNVFRS